MIADETPLKHCPESLEDLRREIDAIDLPKPDLDLYHNAVANMLANIYTLAREHAHLNLTDNAYLTLDTTRAAMVQCIERFFKQVEKENLL